MASTFSIYKSPPPGGRENAQVFFEYRFKNKDLRFEKFDDISQELPCEVSSNFSNPCSEVDIRYSKFSYAFSLPPGGGKHHYFNHSRVSKESPNAIEHQNQVVKKNRHTFI